MAETAKKETQQVFRVVNTVRRVGTRMHRVKSPSRHRWQLWIAGQRLLRNKELPLTEAVFRKEESKILDMLKAGQIALISPDNVRVTTTPTGQFVLTKSTGATKVLPLGETPSCFKEAAPQAKAPEPKAPPAPSPVPKEPKPGALTDIPNVGAGRARKLEAAGITSYAKVVESGPKGIMGLLNVPPDVAEDIVAAAKKLS